ncbi:lysoplasmalogenase family protein [Caulobacter sp.]|uniref:lysoplasmalogenase family protein n=1 Tax=Caulobacter sp. TaxID=78 RepID=UPI002B4A38B9|nr:lysoplasmalogenase family protein [Caulobacter sp.]HJV43426.1 lysoplasmalogenase family protein [Caulobacter sp.]
MTQAGAAARFDVSKWALIASAIAGVSYIASWNLQLPMAAETTWKGAGVGLLAVYAALKARSADGWLLVAVMVLGTLGDVLLVTSGLTIGALAFLAGHVTAIVLYARNRRRTSPLVFLGATALIPVVTGIAFHLPADRAGAPGIALYSLGLSTMAASALLSRFPRGQVGLGALMFAVSDLLIFARGGLLPATFATGLAVWGLYYLGQLLICVGVARTLSTAHPRESGDPG